MASRAQTSLDAYFGTVNNQSQTGKREKPSDSATCADDEKVDMASALARKQKVKTCAGIVCLQSPEHKKAI
eukprot:9380168-Ditylum_brightwellii.AAC.1